MKKRVIINKPDFQERGHYTYKDSITSNEHTASNSVPRNYDKFINYDLTTTIKGNFLNEKIIEGKLNRSLCNFKFADLADCKPINESSITILLFVVLLVNFKANS